MPHDRIVVFGMSCAGKTTFAQTLFDHHYYCFDLLFHWHLIETCGLSTDANLEEIRDGCTEPKYVLDGWHLADAEGRLLPQAVVYVVFADYDRIIDQYRVPVRDRMEHWQMFCRWYQIHYEHFPHVCYVENTGKFEQRTPEYFRQFVAAQVAARQVDSFQARDQ